MAFSELQCVDFFNFDPEEEEDTEVMKANKVFDPVVGGRHSVRSSCSRSSAGSTGFYDAVDRSPTTSLSPFTFVSGRPPEVAIPG